MVTERQGGQGFGVVMISTTNCKEAKFKSAKFNFKVENEIRITEGFWKKVEE
jgi:hypothetical protein